MRLPELCQTHIFSFLCDEWPILKAIVTFFTQPIRDIFNIAFFTMTLKKTKQSRRYAEKQHDTAVSGPQGHFFEKKQKDPFLDMV